jgi:hypothetical protein
VTIKVPYTFIATQWSIKGQNTLRFTCTSLDNSSNMMVLSLEYFLTEEKVAEIFTKPLASPHFIQVKMMLGVKEVVL